MATLLWAACTPPAPTVDPDPAAPDPLELFERSCDIGSALWGVELCGPMALVDPGTRRTITNRPPPDPSFVRRSERWTGILPRGIPLANTAFEWDGDRWSMVLRPLPDDRWAAISLLAHEAFHRIQPGLGLEAPTPTPEHLQSGSGRLWLRMEIRALADALRSDGERRRAATLDALLFRRARYAAHPGADTVEATLEIQEGLAAYTGARVAREATASGDGRIAEVVAGWDGRDSYERTFAYGTGPALGVLLDTYDPAWRRAVSLERPPHLLLSGALGRPVEHDPVVADVLQEAEARGAAYGYTEIAREEEERDRRVRARLDSLRHRFTVPPVLEVVTEGAQIAFDPTRIVSLGADGTVYEVAVLEGAWGTLAVDEGGVLVAPDWTRLTVAEPVRDAPGRWSGPGWTLELAEGWGVREVDTGRWRTVPATRQIPDGDPPDPTDS